jgi:diguanylate cyclase (GGDEF)-like protein/PAS domain S-box-containing protein
VTSLAHPSLTRGTRLRAFAELATATLDAVAGERRLAALVVNVVGRTIGADATVWIMPVAGAPMTRLASSHAPAEQERLEAALPERLTRADDTAWFDGVALLTMWTRDRLIGAVAVSRPDAEPLTGDDVDFVHALTDVAAATTQNARTLADSADVMEELRRQNELMEHISDALIACDADRRIVNWNAGAERIYGYPRGEALGCDVFALLATRFFTAAGEAVPAEEVFAELTTAGHWHGELHERRADGAPLTVMSSLNPMPGPSTTDSGMILVNRDVTGLRDEHRASHDPLTGLPNRRLLTKRLFHALARRHRNDSSLAVLFIGLGTPEPTTGTYGPEAGDDVLLETSRRLTQVVRQSDTVWRLGRDEFVVVLEDAGTLDNIRRVTERVMRFLAQPFSVGDQKVEVRASVGGAVVDAPADGDELAPETLIDIADEAMHAARRTSSGMRFTYCSGLPATQAPSEEP